MGRHSRKRRDPAGAAPAAPGARQSGTGGTGDSGGTGSSSNPDIEAARQRPLSSRPPRGSGPPPGRGHPAAAPGPGPETPPHGASLFGGSASSAGLPSARGGHPEHREPGGGWGASGTGQGPAPGSVNPGGGPRQEYLDAFDDVFAAGAPGQRPDQPRAAHPAHPGQPGRPGQSAHPGQSGHPGQPGHPGQAQAPAARQPAQAPPDQRIPAQRVVQAPPQEPRLPRQPLGDGDGDGEPPAPLAPIAPPPGKGRKGRTFTGAAAAAVTTVLAVVVAGQVAGGGSDSQTRTARADTERGSGTDQASRTDARPTPAPAPAKPDPAAAYERKMAKVYPLSRELDGPGTFRTVPGGAKGPGGAETLRYRVDVEKELPLDGEVFAEAVHATLNDGRSWAHDGARSFERASSGEVDFVITLASPGTTGEWCAKSGLDTTEQQVSCDSAATERVMINAYRWARGATTFGDALIREYREMLINHEVGHRLGLDHVGCEKEGALAPIMMQQTKSLTSRGDTCRPNAWPHPKR